MDQGVLGQVAVSDTLSQGVLVTVGFIGIIQPCLFGKAFSVPLLGALNPTDFPRYNV